MTAPEIPPRHGEGDHPQDGGGESRPDATPGDDANPLRQPFGLPPPLLSPSKDGEDLDDLVRAVEATLFAAEEPLTAQQIAHHLGGADVAPALAELQRHYQRRGIRLVQRGPRWHFETAPDLAHLLRREKEELRRLSRAATEVLAIVAYHEPVSRAEIEAIRGVQTAKGTLDVLMEAGWVRVAGRREVPGRPVIYATTPDFLAHFGLASLKELPGIDELRAAGLLDPVDDDMIETALARDSGETDEAHEDGDENEADDDLDALASRTQNP